MEKNVLDSADKSKKQFNLAWGITGAGDLLPEIFEVMEEVSATETIQITAILSKAAFQVIKIYRLWDALESIADKILIEKDANSPFIVGALQTGKYDTLLVAPVTGNSVAKIVHGISDSLLTNAVSMTNRTNTKIYLLPVEREGNEVNTTLPNGSKLKLLTRDLDAENTEKLRKMKGITVLDNPEEIKKLVK